MTLQLTRRHFSAAAIATPAIFALSSVDAKQTETTPAASPESSEMVVGLTSSLEEWNTAVGEGTPVGEMGTMFRFSSPIDGVTDVTVGFTTEMATFMEYNFEDEGPMQGDAYAIVAESIPTESMPGEQFLMPARQEDASTFTAQVYTMPSAPNSAILSVMALGAIEAEEAQVVSISISLPNVDGSDHAATGDPGGIGLTRDEWISIYGEPAEGGAETELYPGVGPDGMDISAIHNSEMDYLHDLCAHSSTEVPVSTSWENAVAFTGGSVPEDSVVGQYFTLPSTENGPIALDAVLWISPSLQEALPYKGSILSVLYILEGNTEREIPRIDITMNADS